MAASDPFAAPTRAFAEAMAGADAVEQRPTPAAVFKRAREVIRSGYRHLFEFVEARSGASAERVSQWFATGMLLNVIAALDHARIEQGPGGPAEMVPGQHHVRMNMYIARSEGGTFNVVEHLGHIDPKECEVGLA